MALQSDASTSALFDTREILGFLGVSEYLLHAETPLWRAVGLECNIGISPFEEIRRSRSGKSAEVEDANASHARRLKCRATWGGRAVVQGPWRAHFSEARLP